MTCLTNLLGLHDAQDGGSSMAINKGAIMYPESGATDKDSFVKLIVGHTKLMTLRTALRDALVAEQRPLILGVVGPTGVGKSLLLRLLEQDLTDHWLAEMHRDPSLIPVASICVPAPEFGSFPWESYYHLVLEAHQEPLIQAKVLDAEREHLLASPGESRKATRALRGALENCLRCRRTQAVLIDEGQHLSRATGKVTLADQAGHIVDLARATQTTHVLFGNHELVAMLRLVQDRGHNVQIHHFAPYHWADEQERGDFERVVYTLQQAMPFAMQPDLMSLLPYLYRGCCGCPGILKTWLIDAVMQAIHAGLPTLRQEDLEACAIEKSKLLKIAEEIALEAQILHAAAAPSLPQPPAAVKKRRVAERRPGRDKVGM